MVKNILKLLEFFKPLFDKFSLSAIKSMKEWKRGFNIVMIMPNHSLEQRKIFKELVNEIPLFSAAKLD